MFPLYPVSRLVLMTFDFSAFARTRVVNRAVHQPRVPTAIIPRSLHRVPLTNNRTFVLTARMTDAENGTHGARSRENEEKVEDWKKRAPYKVHESSQHFNAIYEASCHCNRVQYQLSREEPLDSKLCHCTTCQTQHGTLHQSLPKHNC